MDGNEDEVLESTNTVCVWKDGTLTQPGCQKTVIQPDDFSRLEQETQLDDSRAADFLAGLILITEISTAQQSVAKAYSSQFSPPLSDLVTILRHLVI